MFFGSARVDSRERAERALQTLRARGVQDADEQYQAELQQIAQGASSGRATTRTRASWRGCSRRGA